VEDAPEFALGDDAGEFLHRREIALVGADPEHDSGCLTSRGGALRLGAGQGQRLLAINIFLGLCGGDGMSFRARKKKTEGYDLGFVGEICSVEPRWLEAIWGEGGIPVMSSLALGSDGEYYNVNADQMAAACAAACHADALIFLTDVPGVKDAEGTVIPWLKTKEMAALVAASVISGGMLPKLEACTQALKKGVGRVRILPAAKADILPQFYFSKLECGTEVIGA
jgi:acetylglutamate kinase